MSTKRTVLRIKDLELPIPVSSEPADEETVIAIAKFRAGEELTDDQVRRISETLSLNGGGGNKNCNAC